ncbi:hypothetical protein C0992_008488 [Termitomyces sp. T32_za158]|nr:hypothetical protein C0992_008488 [Termitomyces sp. T32_za158]
MRHARKFVAKQRALAKSEGKAAISASSLALSTAQESGIMVEEAELKKAGSKGKGKAKAVPTLPKQRASNTGNKQPAKQSQSNTGVGKTLKVVEPCQEETPSQADPSQQTKHILLLGSVVLFDLEESSSHKSPADSFSSNKSGDNVHVRTSPPFPPIKFQL